MFCDIEMLSRRAVRRRPALRAEAQPRAGPGEGLHVLRRARDGVLLLPLRPSSVEPLDTAGYFDLTAHDLGSQLRKQTVLRLEAMGIPVEYSFHENGPSQHEIDLRYTDALTMADNVHDVPAHHQGSRARPRRATRRSCRSRSPARSVRGCTRTSRCSRATSTRSTIPATSTACRRSRSTSSPGLLVHAERDLRDHEPVGQLVQAADPRLRSAGLQVLGAQQPLGARARAAAEAGQERVDAASSSARPIRRATRTSRSR